MLPQVLAAVIEHFPPPPSAPSISSAASKFVNKPALRDAALATSLPPGLAAAYKLPPQPGAIKYVYGTGVGDGAAVLETAGASLATADGMPRSLKRANKGEKPPPSLALRLACYATSLAAATALALAVFYV